MNTNDSTPGSTEPAFDVTKLLTPMLEFGSAMARMQERMLAALIGTKIGTGGDPDDQDDPGEAGGAELHEAIAVRAEQISRSRPVGDDVGNWLQAEREVLADRSH